MIRIITLIQVLVCSLPAVSLPSWEMDLESCRSSVEFRATGLPVIHVLGQFKEPTGRPLKGKFFLEEGKLTGDASVQMDSCETAVKKQTKTLKEKYFETSKFPEARFSFEELLLPADFWAGKAFHRTLPFRGTLTMRNKQSPISGKAEVTRNGHTVDLDFPFQVSLPNHDLASIQFMGIQMGDAVDVRVRVNGTLTEKTVQ